MGIFKKLGKNRLFILGLLIPLIFQIVYLCIAIPAVKDGNTGVQNLKIAIVNEDKILGSQVAGQLSKILPFKTEVSSGLSGSLDSMNNGDYNMVVYIAPDFTAKSQQGSGQISYYINQSAPSMTKQVMERTALSINQSLNEISFNEIKNTIKESSVSALGQAGLPAPAVSAISVNLNQAFDRLKYISISSDIQKVNNADGFIQTVFPFFIFLMYFVGCLIMTGLQSEVFKSLRKEYSQSKILLSKLVINIAASLVVPCIVIGLAAFFFIPFALGLPATWLLLSVGFFTFLCLLQVFSDWFGIPGMGLAALILFPLQLLTSGLMYSQEILPAFYSAISDYLPATYFGDSMIKMFYGGPSISKDVWILLLIAVICIIISLFTIFKKEHPVRVVINKDQA
jgi:uncharacterized phage infection (PIP) family protein YhgE